MNLHHLITALIALLTGCTPEPPADTARAPLAAPPVQAGAFSCRLEARGGSYTARLDAGGAVSGTYRLTLAGGGADIRQQGDFAARAGESLVLGQADLGRALPNARLSVETATGRTDCPLTTR